VQLLYVHQVLDSQDPVKDMYKKKQFTFGVCKRFATALASLLYIIFGGLNYLIGAVVAIEKQPILH
jgi:hypothetical protein